MDSQDHRYGFCFGTNTFAVKEHFDDEHTRRRRQLLQVIHFLLERNEGHAKSVTRSCMGFPDHNEILCDIRQLILLMYV